MSQWLEVKLGDYVNLLTGFPFKSKNYSDFEEDIKLLRGDNIAQGYLRWENVKRWKLTDDPRESNYFLKTNDVILAMDRPWIEAGLKYSIISNKDLPCLLVQRVACLRAKEILNQQFLRYVIGSKSFTEYVCSIETGTAVPHISGQQIKDYEFLLPPLPEQKAIASVLSSLDDKIDLLHRQNKTLEAIAETLLIQHVLPREDEQNDGLHVLGDYLETISVTHKFPYPQVVFLNTSDIYKGKVLTHELSDVKGLPGQAKKSIKKGDILFSEIRPANGRYALIDFDAGNYVVSTKLMVLRAKQPKLIGLLYFYLTNKQVTDWLQVLAESRSGTFPQITFDQVADLELRLPKESDLDDLLELLDDILLKQSANNQQIQTLENLRDTLLPKLMNGEVRVQYETEQVA